MMTQIQFLIALRKLDRTRLTARDLLLVWAIRETPGIMGRSLAVKLGLTARSGIQASILRLIRRGMIEDRRVWQHSLTPNSLHITQAGQNFLNNIVPLVDDAAKS